MAKSKAFKKFATSGKLKDTIKNRRSQQQKRRKFEDAKTQRSKQRGAPIAEGPSDDEGEANEAEDDERAVRGMKKGGKAGGVGQTVDELFEGNLEDGLEEGSDLEELDEDDEDEDGEEESEEEDEEELVRDEAAMKKTLKELEKNDPEFFKYLKENDRDLLSFDDKGKGRDVDGDDDMEGVDDDDEDMEEDAPRRKVQVTSKMIKGWQEGMIKQNSIRALRNVTIAFRAAAHMNEEGANEGSGSDTKYAIDSPKVFNQLVITALKYPPAVMSHHMPYKTLSNGRTKLQPAKKSQASLQRLLLSHLTTILHLIKSLPSTSPSTDSTDETGGLLLTAVNESSRLLPWLLSEKKHLRAYLKALLDLWSSGSDNIRIASFLAIRKMFASGDDSVKDVCLRNVYKSLLPPLRHTTIYTLPSINLLKNTASELFQLAPTMSYPHAFTAIRMLAMHLRSVVRGTTSGKAGEGQEAFRAVYNWQYVHCLDFWATALGAACDRDVQRASGGQESPLKALIYPLVQIALGVVRLLPSSRYFPLRFHVLTSLIRLIGRTGTYIPLSPFLLELLDSTEFARSNPKKSTIKPLDFEYVIRAPAQYPKTRVYQEGLAEELVFLLADYHATIGTNIAFPEIALPAIMTIKKHLKKGTAGTPKVQQSLKGLVEKLEATRAWIEGKRRNVGFAPKDRSEVGRFLEGVSTDTTPIGNWVKLQRKVRERRRAEVEKALREERGGDDSDDE